jgi:hypothetical protein
MKNYTVFYENNKLAQVLQVSAKNWLHACNTIKDRFGQHIIIWRIRGDDGEGTVYDRDRLREEYGLHESLI